MNKTVLLCVAENLHCLVVGDVATLACFAAVVRHIADADTPLFTAVAATFAELGSSVTAGADSDAEVSFVLFEPIGDMLDVHGAVSISIAFSTGMTCMPMPAPPGGTIGVTIVKGRYVIRSKNIASSGCSSSCFFIMLVNSAEPGTNIGSV